MTPLHGRLITSVGTSHRGRSALVATLAIAVLSATGLTACGSSSAASGGSGRTAEQQKVDQSTTIDQLYALAKQEGSVEFWGPEDDDEMKQLAAVFNKKYPGIKVNHFETEAGDSVPKIAAEEKTGNLEVDLVEGGLDTIQPLLDRDLVEPHTNWGLLPIPKNAVGNSNRTIDWYNIAHPLGINTSLLPLSEAPKTWNDLLDPKWAGKLLLEPRCKSLGYLGETLGDAGLKDYAEKLLAQKPILTSGGTATAQQLAAGQAPLALGMYSYQIDQLKQQGAPVDWIPLSPMGANQTVMMTMRGAAHPAAALLLAIWLGSNEGLAAHRQLTGKGSILEGPDAQRIKKAGAKLVIETAKNTDQLGNFEDECANVLGGNSDGN